MNSFTTPTTRVTRRQLLAATACSIFAKQASWAATYSVQSNVDPSRIVRQIASWEDAALRCWFEGQASDVSQVVDDAQAIWSDRAVVHHLDVQDLELLLKPRSTHGVPLARVGCATSHHLTDAAEAAFIRAGRISLRHTEKMFYAGLVLISLSDDRQFLESLKTLAVWVRLHIPDEAFFGVQVLIDPSLKPGSKRVSVAIAA